MLVAMMAGWLNRQQQDAIAEVNNSYGQKKKKYNFCLTSRTIVVLYKWCCQKRSWLNW